MKTRRLVEKTVSIALHFVIAILTFVSIISFVVILILLTGCGSSGSPESKPEPVLLGVKDVCISVNVVHIPIHPSDWVYLDELYSITFSGDIEQQESIFRGSELSSDTIQVQNNIATIDFYAQGDVFTINADYTGYNNLNIEVREMKGDLVSYSFEYTNIDMNDCWE